MFLKKNLTEAEAFKHEIYMIAILGRKDLGTGILRNLTNGGEGASGAVQSAETKKKKSESKTGEKNPMFGMSGEKNPMFGVPRTEEWKKAHSERMSGENHPMFGVPHTEEWKKAVSEKLSGRYTGENHPNYGNTGALNPGSRAIIVIEPDGTKRHYGSIIDAVRDTELGIGRGTLNYFLKNGHVLTKGKFKDWQFLYENP